jgi:alpha-D-xyloside xylohydrolase
MHNLYPFLYNKTVFELTERTFGRGLTWGRSGYAGSQRYPVQWGGDSYSSLDQMAGQLRGLLSYGLSGVPFCSHDVGGFDYSPQAFDYETQDDFPKDGVTYVRWLQFGVFSSHLRAHGKQPREPWTYDQDVSAIARRYLKLRYRLLPYIYSQAVKATRTGLPLVKPLVLEYQDDPNTYHLDLQYLFGDDLLVAPVFSRDGRARVYLPAGQWVDYWTKELETGGQWVEVNAPLEIIPLWVRAGAIIPMGPEQDYVGQKPLDPLTLELYYPAAGENETPILDEDAPQITAKYAARPEYLDMSLSPVPGEVEVVVYGLEIARADCQGTSLELTRGANETRLRFNGQTGGRLRLDKKGGAME